MEFDVIELTNEQLARMSTIQIQLLRTAQKKKNELALKRDNDKALFKKLVLTNGMNDSSLIAQKNEELDREYNYQLDILTEQLDYSLSLNEPYPDDGGNEENGYIVDYTLSYTDRYILVRNYYLAIEDPAQRMALYAADETAKKYLGSYYSTLYDVLSTYSK